jgi:hypothetical protein
VARTVTPAVRRKPLKKWELTTDFTDNTDGEFFIREISEIPVRHRQATADVVKCLPLRLGDSARDGLFCLGLVFRSFNLWQALASSGKLWQALAI